MRTAKSRWKLDMGRALIIGLLLGWVPCLTLAAETTIVLVRHAEKRVDQGSDPDLAPDGQARADALAQALISAHLDRIYTTQLKRTQQTAEPTATAARIEPTVIPIGDDGVSPFIQSMVATLRTEAAGKTVLVVGHSNTIPQLVAALTGTAQPRMDEHDYDDLFIVQLEGDGTSSLIHSRYGNASDGR